MDNIKNKTALITGGASGLGYTYAQKLLQNGAKAVILLDLSSSVGQTSVANLEKEFGKGKAMFFPCDVTDTKKFEETFKKAWNTFNGLDIVINNAGLINDNAWQKTLDLNVGGVIQGSLLAMEHMGKHKGGKGGTLVNIASIVGLSIFSTFPVYTCSKHAVIAFSRCLQERYETTGVRVLVMCPGVTSTALFDHLKKGILDFIDFKEVEDVLNNLPSQPPESVAQHMMALIQKGTNGATWVSEGSQPPYAVEFVPVKRVDPDM